MTRITDMRGDLQAESIYGWLFKSPAAGSGGMRPHYRLHSLSYLFVAKLQLDEYKQELQKTLSSQLASSPPDQSVTKTAHDAVDGEWNRIRDVTYKAASDTL